MIISQTNPEPTDNETSILLVDDDPSILALLEVFVSSYGYDSECATDGEEAVALLKDKEFDIVVTDVMMPKMNGLELLAHIQKYNPGIGVIVVTGFSDSISYTDVIRAGASDFISKPFNRDELEAKLNRIIREQRTIRELERLSTYDSLTDLYNRRYFDIRLWEEAHRSHRQEYPLYLAIADVDRFKKYNDTFGHQAGDNVLQAIGRVINQCTRKNVDTNFRYGGDEFAIILPQTTAEQAMRVAERIVQFYQELGFGMTSLSIGFARFVRHHGQSWTEDIDDLVNRADKTMYKAKNDPNLQIQQDQE